MPIALLSADLRILNMRTRLPFRYGIVTMTSVPHLFVRGTFEVDGVRQEGFASDHLPPKWFTKDPNSHFRDDLKDMFAVIRSAFQLGTETGARPTVYGLWSDVYAAQKRWGDSKHLPPLLYSFGVSLVERASIDAFCRAKGTTFGKALRAGQLGLDIPHLFKTHADTSVGQGVSLDLLPAAIDHINPRHTVGLIDPLIDADIPPADRVDDGLPQSLEASIKTYGLSHFKIKLAGDVEKDAARLKRLATLIAAHAPKDYAYTLDANENFQSLAPFRRLWQTLSADASLKDFLAHLLFIEQPVHRDVALTDDLRKEMLGWTDRPPMIIDESDGQVGSLLRALDCGYVGTSHKNCKGVFKSVANRCLLIAMQKKSPQTKYMMSGEDLSNVGPIALLQDCCVAANLGIASVERNGHHYFRGLTMSPPPLQQQVQKAHPDVYRIHEKGFPTVNIRDGSLDVSSTVAAPFGINFAPDLSGFTPIDDWSFDSLGLK
jgi:hypothetical protein